MRIRAGDDQDVNITIIFKGMSDSYLGVVLMALIEKKYRLIILEMEDEK